MKKKLPVLPAKRIMKTPLHQLAHLYSFIKDHHGSELLKDVEIEELAPGFLRVVPRPSDIQVNPHTRDLRGPNKRFVYFRKDQFSWNGRSQVGGGPLIEDVADGWKRCIFELWDSQTFDVYGLRPFFESERQQNLLVSEATETKILISEFLKRISGPRTKRKVV